MISFEEFGLVQGQLIEYKTENYSLNETLKRLALEKKKLGEDHAKIKKDLDKAARVIATSKKNQEVAGKYILHAFMPCTVYTLMKRRNMIMIFFYGGFRPSW